MSFHDHFSTQAASYAAARPGYPAALYDHLLELVGPEARVWEAACGSAQATVDLASRFAHVHASEPSAAALAHAPALERVDYDCAPAERCALKAGWELPRLLAYVRSYSAVARYQRASGEDPVDTLAATLARHWPDPFIARTVHWPMPVHLRRKQD